MQKLAFGFLMLLISAFPTKTFAQGNPNYPEFFIEWIGVNVSDSRLDRRAADQLSALYSYLPLGNYVFTAKAANGTRVLDGDGVPPRRMITHPWWRTIWAYAAYVVLFVIGVRVVHVFQKGRVIRLERAKAQAKEIQQAREIEKAYETLKATQAQLIQSEKMAGLGVLTAGIAHEIQNPLNFVTNFSEVSSELVRELQVVRKKKQDKKNIDLENEIVVNLMENLNKISQHCKRADAIVKSMVEHSRTTSGQKELTNINALIESSLQLAYHGYCSKEKNCSCELKTILDGTLPQVNIIPQDIGRVLLNLFNNAFYAVNEKLKSDTKGYKPVVRVTSKNINKSLKISIFDNGVGIPAGIKDKIFNPFFTTKPSGKGTGLGLSLAYDIVKAHRGEIKAESEEGKGTTFIITLPVT